MIVAIFRARIRKNIAAEYYQRADEMSAIASKMPGFLSFKAYTSPDGERVSVHEWESAEHLRAWREHPEHKRMQQYGREHFYEAYTLYVCDQPRESRFTAGSLEADANRCNGPTITDVGLEPAKQRVVLKGKVQLVLVEHVKHDHVMPSQAKLVQRLGEREVVFLAEGGVFEAQPITAGRRDGERVEVVAGVAAGQRYVAEGSFLLKAELGKSGAGHHH